MTTYSWTGTASTDFSNAANWIDTVTGAPAGVPGVKDKIDLSGSGEITGTGAVSAIDVSNAFGLGWILDGQFASQTVSDLGTLTIRGEPGTGSSSRLAATKVDVTGGASVFTLSNALLNPLGDRLDLLVSTSNAGSGNAYAQFNVGADDHDAGSVDLGSGTATIGNGDNETGSLALYLGSVTGGADSAIIVGKDGASGDLEGITGQTALSVGALILGDSGNGSAVFHNGITLTLGHGYGPALVIGAQDGASGVPTGSGELYVSGGLITVNGLTEVGEATSGSLSLSYTTLNTNRGLIIGGAESGQGTVTLDQVAWTDIGNVVVGDHGHGALQISTPDQPLRGSSTIDGNVQVGAAGGTGDVTIQSATLTVNGNTVLGPAHQDTITLQNARWNSAGHSIHLLAGNNSGPYNPGGDSIMLTAESSLIAGFLSVGTQDTVQAQQAATITLGSLATRSAATILGGVIVAQDGMLTALGNVHISQSFYANQEYGLQLFDGTANLTATDNFALTLVNGGLAEMQGTASVLAAQGGILAGSGGGLIIQAGTATARSTGLALDIVAGGNVRLVGGQLNTDGELSINDSHYHAQNGFGGTLTVYSGATLDSTAIRPGGLAVAVAGGYAQIGAADWTVDGRFEVGASGSGGFLMSQGSQIGIDGVLAVGGRASVGQVVTADTDTVISGGTLTAGQTGIAAASIVVGGDGSSINTGTLDVGTASARGSLAINNGAVRVAGAATINGVVRLGHGGLLSAQAITVQANATVLGSGTLSGTIVDQGAIVVSHGLLTCLGPVTGDGVLRVGDGTLQLGGTETVSVVFGNAGTLVAPSVSDVAGTLSGWQAGDAILFGQAVASDSYANGTLSLFDSHQALLGTELFTGSLSGGNFVLTQQETGGSLLSFHQ